MPSQCPHWPALRARTATIEGKGQWTGTRPDTLQPLDLYSNSTFPSPQWTAPSKRAVEREATQSWDQGKEDSTANREEPFV